MSEKLTSALIQSPTGGLFSTLSVDGSGIVIKNASDDTRSDGTFVPAGSDTLVLSAVGESSFLNASYMKVGVLDASLMRTGLLQTVASWNSKWYGSSADSMDVQQGFAGGKFSPVSVSTTADAITLANLESAAAGAHNISNGDYVRVSGLVFDVSGDDVYGNVGVDSPGSGVIDYSQASGVTATNITYNYQGIGAGKTTLSKYSIPFVSKVVPVSSISRVYDDGATDDNPGELSTVTVNTASAHGLSTGNYVELHGVEDSLNGVWRVSSAPTSTQFTFMQRFVEDLDWEDDGSVSLPEYGAPVAIEVAKSYRVTSDGTILAFGAVLNPAGQRRSALLLQGNASQGDIATPADNTLQIGYRTGTDGLGGSFVSTMTLNNPASGTDAVLSVPGTIEAGIMDAATKLNLPALASAPSSPSAGTMYFNTGDDTVYVWDGAAWTGVGSGTAGPNLVVETLRITNTADASGSSTAHALTIGSSGVTGQRLIMDGNELSSKDGTANGSLFLNPDGGGVFLGASASGDRVDVQFTTAATSTTTSGALNVAGGIRTLKGVYFDGDSVIDGDWVMPIPGVGSENQLLGYNALRVGDPFGEGFSVTTSGKVFINNTEQSTSTGSGSITTLGGLGVAKNLTVGGNFSVSGAFTPAYITTDRIFLTSTDDATGTSTTHPLTIGSSGANFQRLVLDNNEVSSKLGVGNATLFLNPDGGDITLSAVGSTVSIPGTLSTGTFSPSTISTTNITTTNLTTTSGVTLASGGGTVSIGSSTGASFSAAGKLTIANTTAATSTTTGALEVAGGVGIVGTLHAGNITTTGTLSAGTFSPSTISTTSLSATNINSTSGSTLASAGGNLTIGGNNTTGSMFVGQATAFEVNLNDGTTYVKNADDATATAGTGSLIVSGGLRVAKQLRVTGTATFSGNVTYASLTTRVIRNGSTDITPSAADTWTTKAVTWATTSGLQLDGTASPQNPGTTTATMCGITALSTTGATIAVRRGNTNVTTVMYIVV